MAKPSSLFASSSSSARRHRASPSSSSSSSTSPHPPLNRSLRSRRPGGTNTRTRTRTFALLAALSAAPLSAHAYPLDPPETSFPFLYPPFALEPTKALAKRSVAPSTSDAAAPTTTGAPPSPSSQCQYDRANLPDKYTLGDDGYWHKTPWSLYGSAYCNLPCSPTHPDNSTNVAGGPPPPSFDDFDLSSLPTGWTSISVDDVSRRGIVVVLALSVALALVIIVFMFACIFWRRKNAPRPDPERTRRRSSDSADDDGFRSIQEVKAAQRKWYRAATRWRVSAHRRRTNRTLAPAKSYSTLTREEGVDGRSFLSRSRPSSPTLSQRSVTPTPLDARSSSVASIHSSLSPLQTPRMLTSTDLPLPRLSPSPTQPPAYDPPPSPHVSPENTYSSCDSSGTMKPPMSSHTQSQPYGDADGHLTSLSGHVATDDKAVLSLRATLASAPPASSSNILQPASVPSMEDEDAFEWPSGSRPPSPSLDEYNYEPHPPYSPPTSLFPPPPSKGKQRFDYSHDLDMSVSLDSAMVEPQLGPSAPPSEECEAVPSAPPFDFDEHVPSAPPMNLEDCPDTTVSGLEDDIASEIPT